MSWNKGKTPSFQDKTIYICDRCGARMVERQCKVVCPNCGSRMDCSDLTVRIDKDEMDIQTGDPGQGKTP